MTVDQLPALKQIVFSGKIRIREHKRQKSQHVVTQEVPPRSVHLALRAFGVIHLVTNTVEAAKGIACGRIVCAGEPLRSIFGNCSLMVQLFIAQLCRKIRSDEMAGRSWAVLSGT